MDRGSCHAAVKDVANNRDVQPLQILPVAQDCIGVEQRLCWMFVHSITRVDHGNIQIPRHQRRSASIRMTDYDHVSSNRTKRVSGIYKRFALLDTRSAR